MWMIVFGCLPFVGLAYVLWHIWLLLPWTNGWKWCAVAFAMVSFLSIFLNFSRTIDKFPLRWASVVYEVGNSSIFILLYLVMIFLVLDIARVFHLIPKTVLIANGITAAALTAFMVGIFLYGNLHYRRKYRQELSLHKSSWQGGARKIVLLSDLHLGYHNRRAEFRRWVDMLNAEQPDLILIGGDIIDISVRPLVEEDMAAEFRRLKAPVVACLGNHEYYSGEPQAAQFYKDAGITLLRDSAVTIAGIQIIGRDDRTNLHRKTLKDLRLSYPSDAGYTILLDHQPYRLEEAEQEKIDFQFSGHTHHGQVWPISWITDRLYEDAFGPLQKGHTFYYVSSGMGIWGGKFRIGTRSEYVVATLDR